MKKTTTDISLAYSGAIHVPKKYFHRMERTTGLYEFRLKFFPDKFTTVRNETGN